ncbi:MAG: sigma-54 dependent transcriptional regulator [Candidatus Margulisbacteria bacterium]|jgi:DNA-binding NtrC family response regulator|nr:sigma-54 dependent transcriptional regulator [Candidatus Margulisiibacteriota bacterium]
MTGTKAKILVVDDEKSMRDSLHLLLKDRYHVLLAGSGREAIEQIRKQPIDLVLLDIRLPEIDGIEVLKLIKGIDDAVEVIMVTAVITVGKAVEAIRAGAYDYITKPFDIAALTEQVEKIMEKRLLARENQSLRQLLESDYQYEKIVGKSPAIREVFRVVEEVAKSNATVLITGESGTGKELVARAIHNRSPRQNKLFVAVNCAAIPENLLESELFGHEKGSFTGAIERQIGKFEIASGGTLFLDEIGTLPLPMQAKLLRALQEKEIERLGGGRPVPVDVRIVAATNGDLKAETKNRRFREDLFYRLNVIPLHLPPLRERAEDVPLLAEHFLHKYNHEFGKKIKGFKPEVLPLLAAYDWPGNVRELENLIERLVVLTQSAQIDAAKLPPEVRGNLPALPGEEETRFRDAVRKFESAFIKQAIGKAGGKKGEAAKMLGIHRNTLLQLEKKYKIK